MQIFNQLNSRRLDNYFNVFKGIYYNYFFLLINAIIIGGQAMIVFVGSCAFLVVKLNAVNWVYSIVLGALSILVKVIIRLILDEMIYRCTPGFLKGKSTPEVVVSNEF
jgi:P-type Ca2+ transporter type 2C